MNHPIRYCILLFFALMLGGCEQGPQVDTGGIAVRLVWPSPAALQARRAGGYDPRSGLPSSARTVRVRINAPDMNNIEKDFAASAHRGRIEGVPAGRDRTLTVQALDSQGGILASCEKGGLLIEAGRTTQAGDCVFQMVGGPGLPPAPADPSSGKSNAIEPEMISIKGSSFMMGSPEEEEGRDSDERQHKVTVGDFLIGQYEVTNGEYVVFLNEKGGSPSRKTQRWVALNSDFRDSHLLEENGTFKVEAGYEHYPVAQVSWYGAVAYAEWLSSETGKSYRLPTEAEWEYAARAGTTTRYWWGDENPVCRKGTRNGAKFDDDADCDGTGVEPVGFSAANPWGLYDVYGNVWELTCSKYERDYDGSEKGCSSKDDNSSFRALRGGSWSRSSGYLRSASRVRDLPDNPYNYYSSGFRLVRDTPLAVEPKMIGIKGGSFMMGSPEDEEGRGQDERQHSVTVGDFLIGQYEVTNGQYVAFLNEVGLSPDRDNEPWVDLKSEDGDSRILWEDETFKVEWGFMNHPVVQVSWYGAMAYAQWLRQKSGKNYRLPTEAEWEYAARAGTITPYFFGSDAAELCQHGNTLAACNDGYDRTSQVGQFKANPWGLYDMYGNVWEWTCSKYVREYDGSEKICMDKSDVSSYNRVIRGGSWASKPDFARSAMRFSRHAGDRNHFMGGFRLAQDAD